MSKLNLLAAVALLASACSAAELVFEKRLLLEDNNEASAVADYNKDGILDFSAGRNWYAGPDYKPQALREVGTFGKDYFENNGEHAIDIDGDGWLDILSGSFMPKEVYWYRNPGAEKLTAGGLWEKFLIATTAGSNEITYLHDLDGDGQPEYVANSWNAKNPQLAWTLALGEKASMSKCTLGDCNGHGIGFGDINGDGRGDVLFGEGWYEQPAADPLKNQWTLHKDWKFQHASCPMIVTDLDGDGRNDIIWGNGHGYGVQWMQQLPPENGTTKWEKHVIDESWSQAHALAWEDLDGDGQPELITGKRVRAHSGSDPGAAEPPFIYRYTWDRATLKFTRHTIAEGVGTGLFIRIADLDKNGTKDLVLSGKNGTWLLFNKGMQPAAQ